jgi:uncharacterized protein YlxP (DUF503 family)
LAFGMSRVMGLLVLEFHLPGCTSLKEKRGRLGGLRDRFGRLPHVAVTESDFADALQRSEWSFVAVGHDVAFVSGTLQEIERDIVARVDAVVTRRQREIDS